MSLLDSYPVITVEDYLNGEPEAKERHEYLDGRVYAMAGATQTHNRIAGAIFASLFSALKGSSCSPFMSDMKVQVKTLASESYYYPDVVVSCDAHDTNPLFLQFPSTIIEVLSDSTERIDREEKFLAYKSIPSVQEYILVSQQKKEITIARRENDWKPQLLTGEKGEIPLSCGTSLRMEEIYDQVKLG